MDTRFERLLLKRFYRFDCPSPDDLGDFFMDLLPVSKKKEIHKHLEYCLFCREELKVLEELLKVKDKPEIEKTPHLSLKKLLKKAGDCINQIIQIQPVPLGALRGLHQDLPCRGEVESIDGKPKKLELYWGIEKQEKSNQIQVQCLSEDDEGLSLVNSLVEVWQENNLIATTTIDTFYTFRFNAGELLPMIIRITNKNKILYKFKVLFKG